MLIKLLRFFLRKKHYCHSVVHGGPYTERGPGIGKMIDDAGGGFYTYNWFFKRLDSRL